MKNSKIIALIVLLVFMITACNVDNRMINGKQYHTIGLLSDALNPGDGRQPGIRYEPIWLNIILGAIFVETIFAPIYVFGFDCLRPVGTLPNNSPDCKKIKTTSGD
jgi:hypothetical protein